MHCLVKLTSKCFACGYNSFAKNIFTSVVCKQKFSPLEGIKVLDLTRIVAGPYCTMLLGDLGAEIIKIEQPEKGDESRRWGPFVEGSNDVSCYFISLNRNKKSICVNLKSPTGKNIVKKLAKKCDILVENYVPGKLNELGLGYDELKKFAPHLIYCSVTGYGNKGPYIGRPGFDVIAASVGGLLHITGPKDGEPCKTGVAMTDIATGLYAYGAIMTALLQRQRTGVGQKIDCNLLSTQISCLINVGSSYLNANEVTQRLGTGHPSIVPYESFPTADGFITIGAGSNDQFAKLCKVLELDHLVQDPRFISNISRVKNRDSLINILKDKFISKTNTQWLNILEGCSFPFGPVNSLKEVFEDQHVKEIGIVEEVMMEENNSEKQNSLKIKIVGPPVEYSDSENKIRLPPPRLGQHTSQVLMQSLKFSYEEIEELIRHGDVQ